MATIHLSVSMKCTEDEIKSCKVNKIQELVGKLQQGLELVKKSCEEKFPELTVEWDSFDPSLVDHEYDDGIWQAMYWMEVRTKSPHGNPDLDFEVSGFDRWDKMGMPTYQDISEYLHEADWSLIKPFCGGGNETLGEMVSVQFDLLKAVDSYSGEDYHFYHNYDWL